MSLIRNRQDIRDSIDLQLVARSPQGTLTPDGASPTSSPDPPPQSSTNNDNKGGLAKTVLEYLFLAVALLIAVSIISRRLSNMRRARQPLSAFFRVNEDHACGRNRGPRSFPRTTGLPPVNYNGTYPLYPDSLIPGVPAAYLGAGNIRTQAPDIDGSGRRAGGGTTEFDHGGYLGDKDVLPAYEVLGSPPKYIDFQMHSGLVGLGALGGTREQNAENTTPDTTDTSSPTEQRQVEESDISEGIPGSRVGEPQQTAPPTINPTSRASQQP